MCNSAGAGRLHSLCHRYAVFPVQDGMCCRGYDGAGDKVLVEELRLDARDQTQQRILYILFLYAQPR
jgi:hypothetical protein